MTSHSRTALFAAVVLVVAAQAARPADPARDGEVRPLESGPVHEAFADSGVDQIEPSPVVPKAPPRPLNEDIPDDKPEEEHVQWVGGYWAFDEGQKDHVWVSGVWRVPPPGRQWVSGYWTEAKGGWQR